MDKHKVSLKVLRLSRPILKYSDNLSDAPVPQALLSLPGSFGSVYVGEQFSCLLSINKDNGDGPAVKVKLAVSMALPGESNSQTPISVPLIRDAQKIVLDSENITQQHVVHYEAKDAGLHVLNVTITYMEEGSESSDPISFRKNYRFTANPGLSVKTKISKVATKQGSAASDVHLIEAQIENVTDSTLTLETIDLLAQEGFSGRLGDSDGNLQPPTLLPADVWQSLFVVERQGDKAPLQATPHQSKLTLSWRREPLGEKGWLTTGEIGYPLQPSSV